tara:strand:- start:195397 stop:195804 length:408 start_codon:yes stop_codon:yes gene_type:complete
MTDFMSRPRFQIPSASELKQARMIKELTKKALARVEFKLALTTEFFHRVLEQKKSLTRAEQMLKIRRELKRRSAEVFYLSIISNPKATVREQLFAQERIDKLFGLDKSDEATSPDQDNLTLPEFQISDDEDREEN